MLTQKKLHTITALRSNRIILGLIISFEFEKKK